MLTGQKCSCSEAIVAETETHFEGKGQSYRNKGIEKLENCTKQKIGMNHGYIIVSYIDKDPMQCLIAGKYSFASEALMS